MDHHLRKQTLRVTLDSEALALALQPRLDALNRTTFQTTIERVFDDVSLPGHHIFIDRLEIDLGTVSKADLDYEVGARFERKLREALQLAISRVERRPSREERVEPDEHAQLEVLDRYLLTGTLPFWVPGGSFILEDWIARLSTTAPEGLVDLLRRRRFDARVVQRLAHQLGEAPAQRLLRPSGPADGDWVRELYRIDPLAFLALLRDSRDRLAGEQLLSGLERADLDNLVRLLAPESADRTVAGLAERARSQDRDRAEQSMRAIILDLAADWQRGVERSLEPKEPPQRFSDLRGVRLQPDRDGVSRVHVENAPGEPDREATVGRLQDLHRTNLPAFVALIRRLGPRPVVQRLLLRFGHAVLEDLVRHLAPEHGAQIAADVAGLAGMAHFQRRTDPGQALRHLWLVAVDVQLRTLERPYDRRAFVHAVLASFAESDGHAAHAVFTAITREPQPFQPRVASRDGPGTVSLRSLLAEMAADGSFEPPAPDGSVEPPSPVEADLLTHAPGQGSSFARYDRVEAVQYYIRHGVLPYSISLLRPGLTAADVLDVLPELPLSTLRAASADLDAVPRRHAWRRVVRELPRDRLTRLIDGLIEQTGLPAARTWSQLSTGVASAADPSLVYTELIVRLLEGRGAEDSPVAPSTLVQHASEATPVVGGPEVADASAWEAHHIKAVLSSRARGIAQARAHEPTSLRLLLRLVELQVEGARDFLRALKQAGVAPSVLVDEAPSAGAVNTIQKLLTPDAASGLTRLLESVAALAPDDRPADELVSSVIVRAILEQRAGSQPLEAFLDTVLRELAGASRAEIRRVEDAQPRPPETTERAAPPADVEASPDLDAAPDLVAVPDLGAATDLGAAPAWLHRLAGVPEAAARTCLPEDAIRHALLRQMDDAPEIVHVALIERIGDPAIRERWARELSEPELVRMAYVLEPRGHRVRMDAAELLFEAWLGVAPDRGSTETRRSAFWSFVFGFLADTSTSGRALDRLIAYFFDVFGGGEHDALTARAEEAPTRVEDSLATRAEDELTARVEDSLTTRAEDALTAQDESATAARVENALTVRVDDAVTPRTEKSLTTRAQEPATARGDDGRTGRPEDALTGPVDGAPTGRADEAPTRVEDSLTTRAEDALTGRADDAPTRVEDSLTTPAGDPRTVRVDDARMGGADDATGPVEHALTARDEGAPTARVEDAPAAQVEPHTTARPIERLLDAAAERASAVGSAAVRAILDRDRALLIAGRSAASVTVTSDSDAALPASSHTGIAEPAAPRTQQRGRMAFSLHREEGDDVDPDVEAIYIANAGLVLTNPFLPQWCRALDLLETTDTGKIRLRADRMSRAVHLLQWLVDGSAATPEPLLCLNKLLCGATPATPVERQIEPDENEVDVCRLLLKSVLANWTIISSTSIEGLQETFLQREGRLEQTSGGWRLTVQRKTVDVLIDQIPWSISTIFHAWMPEPITVIW